MMKVLAKAKGNSFICEVGVVEVKKFLNIYYSAHLNPLEVGVDVDLGKGYDFASDAREALKKTQEFIESNGDIVKAIVDGVKVFGLINGENNENNN